MIAFTVLGLLFFWVFCFQIGYTAAEFHTAKSGISAWLKPGQSEMSALVYVLAEFNVKKERA